MTASHLSKRVGALALLASMSIIAALVITRPYRVFFVYNPLLLVILVNFGIIATMSFIVAYVAVRSFLIDGSPSLLLMGCGVLAFGMATVSTYLGTLPGEANAAVTAYNTISLLASGFQFASAIQASKGSLRVARMGRTVAILSYLGVLVSAALLTIGSLEGAFPLFFVQGIGATPLRNVVLGTAIILFAASSALFMKLYYRSKSDAVYWYSLGLAFMTLGLSSFFLVTAVGDLTNWLGRFAQSLGSFCFLISVLVVVRDARGEIEERSKMPRKSKMNL